MLERLIVYGAKLVQTTKLPTVISILAPAICFHLWHTRKQDFLRQMAQVFPDTPGVIYRLLNADSEFSDLVGSYRFEDGTVTKSLSLLTPGSNLRGIQSVEGVECVINDISNVKRFDFVNDSSIFINEWKVFLVAWGPATGEDVNNAARRIMQLFRGATSIQTVKTSEGLNAQVQTVVTIPSNQPLDIDGMAVYGPEPAITISSDINYIEPGQDVELTWTITSATRAELDQGFGPIDLSGSSTFTVNKTTVFTITAYNDFTNSSAGFEVTVLDPLINFFDFSRTSNPNEYTVSWSTSYATEIRFNGRYDWPLAGSTTLTVNSLTEFQLEAYSEQAVVTESIIIDPEAPILLGANTSNDGSQIILTFDELLSETVAPISAFEILVDSLPAVITDVTVNGATVELTLETPVTSTQTINFSYTAPTPDFSEDNEAVQDLQGNDTESVTSESVTNDTDP